MSDLSMPGSCLSSVAGECDDSLGHCNTGTVMIVVISLTIPRDLLHRYGQEGGDSLETAARVVRGSWVCPMFV